VWTEDLIAKAGELLHFGHGRGQWIRLTRLGRRRHAVGRGRGHDGGLVTVSSTSPSDDRITVEFEPVVLNELDFIIIYARRVQWSNHSTL
jgi:hypothetical protein